MLKRKWGDRAGWKRVIERTYKQAYLDTNEFAGYITLLNIKKVSEPAFAKYDEEEICIADNGYIWLQQFPLNAYHTVTTTFDSTGKVVQWYIDICIQTGVNNKGVPWMDDLFLDIVVLPSGKMFQLDAEELEEALEKGIINQDAYDLAWKEADRITQLIEFNNFDLLKLSYIHLDFLLENIE
ncbi:MAG TPA: DUF402 domain-containing protein [Bacillus sp. (in: firmicutes)]|uniref:DUF402 domain-containing protein n=1 Tax=Bacillus litorisediminis TaxID=2922713 RepID=UPI001FAB9FB3|nr:DUF402 domain-containing protein [Bacillus litorisediminis]HWO75330.1 DUF402 domain-containing protein [Bacillus sp. (in: firmicutes)]